MNHVLRARHHGGSAKPTDRGRYSPAGGEDGRTVAESLRAQADVTVGRRRQVQVFGVALNARQALAVRVIDGRRAGRDQQTQEDGFHFMKVFTDRHRPGNWPSTCPW